VFKDKLKQTSVGIEEALYLSIDEKIFNYDSDLKVSFACDIFDRKGKIF
jgi:hypothetical protein